MSSPSLFSFFLSLINPPFMPFHPLLTSKKINRGPTRSYLHSFFLSSASCFQKSTSRSTYCQSIHKHRCCVFRGAPGCKLLRSFCCDPLSHNGVIVRKVFVLFRLESTYFTLYCYTHHVHTHRHSGET